MKIKLLTTIIFLFLFCFNHAQNFPNIIKRDGSIPEIYLKEKEFEIKKTEYFVSGLQVDNETKGYITQQFTEDKINSFSSNMIYYHWSEAEKYLNSILNKLLEQLPDTFKYKPYVYLGTGSDFNASAFYEGSIIFNASCLVYLENEAEIAAILSHELIHYIKQHSLKSLQLELIKKSEIKTRIQKKNFKLGILKMSREMESEADSLGFQIFSKSGYDTKSFLTVEEKLNENTDRYKRFITVRIQGSTEEKYSSHPSGEKRIKFANRQITRSLNNTGEKFQISESDFNRFKKQAKIELLQNYDDEGLYFLSMEAAFFNYLEDTSDNNNIYFILEGLRKFCFNNPNNRKATFLTSLYSVGSLIDYNSRVTQMLTPSIMKRLDQAFPNQNFAEKVQDTILLNRPYLVHSCNKAFNYFEKKAIQRKLTECYLSIALNEEVINKKFKNYITLYINDKDSKYKDYARFLIEKKKIQKSETFKQDVYIVEYTANCTKDRSETNCMFNTDILLNDFKLLIQSECDKKASSNVIKIPNNVNFTPIDKTKILLIPQIANSISGNIYNFRFQNLIYFDPYYYYKFVKDNDINYSVFIFIEDDLIIKENSPSVITHLNQVEIKKRMVCKTYLPCNPKYETFGIYNKVFDNDIGSFKYYK